MALLGRDIPVPDPRDRRRRRSRLAVDLQLYDEPGDAARHHQHRRVEDVPDVLHLQLRHCRLLLVVLARDGGPLARGDGIGFRQCGNGFRRRSYPPEGDTGGGS